MKKEAVELHDKLKATAWDQDILDKKPDRTFDEALVVFLKQNQGKRGFDSKKTHAIHFRKVLGGRLLRSLTSEELINAIPNTNASTGKALSPATYNRYRSSLKRILSIAHKSDWIDKVPYIPSKQEAKIRISWLTKEQASELIKSLQLIWMKNVCSFALFTGARMGEILSLKWNDVNFGKKIAVINCDKAKSGKSRALPLSRDAVILLRAIKSNSNSIYVFTRGKSNNKIGDIDRRDFRQACQKIGLPEFHFHDLRHTWASWHVQAGTPLFTLKELGGWETLEMVKRYAHLNADHMLDYANQVTFSSHFEEVSLLKIV